MLACLQDSQQIPEVLSLPVLHSCGELVQFFGYRAKATLVFLHASRLHAAKSKLKTSSYVHPNRNISDAARP